MLHTLGGNRPMVFLKKGVVKNIANFTAKQLYACKFAKRKAISQDVLPLNFEKIFRASIQ